MTDQHPSGFLLVDKEGGWTSHDVVAKVRHHVSGKVGHAGTLDPMATGLLILGVGRATRLLRFVQGERKEYVARAQLGVATDSLDADGSVLSREPMPVTEADVASVLDRFRGEILQVPPMVSARRVEGKRLYELAREGEVVEREARPVTIHRLDLTDFAPSDYPEMEFVVECSTGTYVRTLADDIARALGGRAHLTALRRTRNGPATVTDASDVASIVSSLDQGHMADVLLKPADALAMPRVELDATTAFRVRNGAKVPVATFEAVHDELVAMVDATGDLLAVYRRAGDMYVSEVGIA